MPTPLSVISIETSSGPPVPFSATDAAMRSHPPFAMASTAFSATVRAYTGYAFDDPVVANAMLKALNGSVGNANIARIAALAASTPPEQLDAALKSAGLENAAEVVVVALYSGTVDTPKGTVVISYDQALVWQACGWTKPNAFCGGQTNYWANAPDGVTP